MPEKSIDQLRAEMASLEAEQAKELEAKARENERRLLEKKINQIKFQKTTLGKVVGGVSKVGSIATKGIYKAGESITRPPKKDVTGKAIPGTGGLGSKMVDVVKKLTAPKPQATTKQEIRRKMQSKKPLGQGFLNALNSMGSQFQTRPTQQAKAMPQQGFNIETYEDMLMQEPNSNFGMSAMQQPMNRRAKTRRTRIISQKPFNVNDVLRSLPQ